MNVPVMQSPWDLPWEVVHHVPDWWSHLSAGPSASAWEAVTMLVATIMTVGAALRVLLGAMVGVLMTRRRAPASPPRVLAREYCSHGELQVEVVDRRSHAPPFRSVEQPAQPEVTPVQPVVTGPLDIPAHRFMIRVLGPVDLVDQHGVPVSVVRAKSLELLAWLALHRPVCSRDAARAALWVRDVSDASFANVVSGARRALVMHSGDPDTEWLGRPQSERLALAPGIVTDVAVFETLVSRARRARSAERVNEFRNAMALVRGAPFEASAYRWADDEARTSSLTLAIVDAARDWAETGLAEADPAAVLEATSAGLRVLPGHEELVALRLRAHHCAGDVAALRAEWVACQRAVAGDPWQSGPTPWLADLAESLLCRTA